MTFPRTPQRDHFSLNQRAPAQEVDGPGTLLCRSCGRRKLREDFPASALRVSTKCNSCTPKGKKS